MIRRQTSPDLARLERLAAVHQAAFAPGARGWSGAEIGDLAGDGVLLADDADRGFALFSHVLDEAELLTIAVDPDHRRQGLARRLLAAGEAELAALGVEKIHLEVAADNVAASLLYQALGYQVGGVRKGYYRRATGAPVDAAMMVKRLSVEQTQAGRGGCEQP